MNSFFYGLRNIIRWLPLVWNDRDWDWAYLARIMRFKLTNMADAIEEGDRHVGAEKHVKQMRVCAHLLTRIIEDQYVERATRHLPPLEMTFGDPDELGMSRVIFGDENNPELRAARLRAYETAARIQSRDLKTIGDIIGKHLTSWWD